MTRFILMMIFLMLGIVGMKPNVYVPDTVVLSEPTELEKFLDHMARRESNNNHTVVNPYGMMGKYQFSPRTVRVLGFNIDKQTFLSRPELQDTIMVTYMRANNRELSDIIRRFEGRTYKGVRITRAGVIAGAHLCGSGNARRFFVIQDHNGCVDANGTSIRDYITEFNSYNLGEIF